MHASRSAHIATRSITSHTAPAPHCVLQLTVDGSTITALRQLVMHFCGDSLEFMRVAVCPGTGKTKVWLCMSAPLVGAVMELILHSVPAAEIGRIKHPSMQ